MLLAVLLYGYCTGTRSSRQVERCCREAIAFRVLSGHSTPDHVTIARFRVRHEQALAELLIQSLKLCAAAGMVRLGLVALDGTKVEANAAAAANRTHAHLQAQVAELLQQAAAIDQAEDREGGAVGGDVLPRALAGRAERAGPAATSKACWRPRPPPANRLPTTGRRTGRRGPGPRPATPGPQPTPTARRGPQPQGDGQHHRS
jgi:Transposase domain (DUF772)